jgi:WhiB family redox-sensing transcriptional regulator
MANAACAAVPTFVFFPDDDKPTAETAAVCDGCETRLECLHAGLCERHGVWGGMSARSRARLRHVLRRLQRTA